MDKYYVECPACFESYISDDKIPIGNVIDCANPDCGKKLRVLAVYEKPADFTKAIDELVKDFSRPFLYALECEIEDEDLGALLVKPI